MHILAHSLKKEDIKVGDKLELPLITGEIFTVIDHEERGICLHVETTGFEAFVSLEEAESYGMVYA